jgi:ABC-2 type transport system ATP-binding protein
MIEAQGLTKHYDDFEAVQDINLNVEAGTLLALLGPNGAGKTTTIRMLTSILVPTAGWARVAGFDVVKHAPQVRASVGVLTEQHGLYERMTGWEYLDFFGQIYRIPRELRQTRAERLLTRFGLIDAANRRVSGYSKGMKQKLALTRALMHDPPVLLLDEPTSAMDPQSARLVRDAIKELKADNRAIILTTHNLNEAQELADRIAIIRHGRIIARGTLEEMTARVVGRAMIEIRTANKINGAVNDLKSIVDVTEVEDYRLCYETENPTAANPQVIRQLLAKNTEIITVSHISRTLEDVYLEIVEEDEGTPEEGVSRHG